MSESHERDPIQGDIVHEYDGILEADNHLPNWWLATFFGTVAFAAIYWFTYEAWHFADSPREQYAAAMEAAAASGGEVSDELLGLVASSQARVSDGERTFAANCAACHGARGEGVIGPNLTDPNWIHGGAPTSIYATVRNGVATAGMPAWGPVLGEREVQSVVAYVLSIRDTNVPGRDPQGEVWVPGAVQDDAEGPADDTGAAEDEADGDGEGRPAAAQPGASASAPGSEPSHEPAI